MDIDRMKADAKLILSRKYYYGTIDFIVFHISFIQRLTL